MTYLDTPATSPLYQTAGQATIPNWLRVFALQPEAYACWRELGNSVKSAMDTRRFELVTLAAARRLGSDYCSLAHGSALRAFFDDATLATIALDHHRAGLDPVDVAIMDFADRVAADPNAVGAAEAQRLREVGLSDVEILQVVLAVCLRRFFSGVLSAVDAVPDDVYDGLGPTLRAALTATSP